MLTSEGSAQSSGIITAAMPQAQDVDKASWSEADFEEKCTYIAKDQPLEEDFKSNRTRAERSLPRILALRRCPNSAEVHNEADCPCLCVQITRKVEFYKAFNVLLRNFHMKLNPSHNYVVCKHVVVLSKH